MNKIGSKEKEAEQKEMMLKRQQNQDANPGTPTPGNNSGNRQGSQRKGR